MIEVFVPSLDPAYDKLLAQIAKACSTMPEIPAPVFAWSLDDAIRSNTARAKHELFAWADNVGIIRPRKTYAPLLWTLHEDGFRHIGMSNDDRSLRLVEVLGSYPGTCAHYDQTVLLTFWDTHTWTNDPRVSWSWYAAFPPAHPHLYGDLTRRAKDPSAQRACRICGCTEWDACITTTEAGLCSWSDEPDVCTACRNPKTRLRGPLLANGKKARR
jgi:hypothetical protein